MKYLLHPIIFIYYIFLFRNLFDIILYAFSPGTFAAFVINVLWYLGLWFVIGEVARRDKWTSRAMMLYWLPAIFIGFYGATH